MLALVNLRRRVFDCDACGSKLTKRTSYRLHRHLRRDVWRCDNDACGAIYVGTNELTSIATRSGDPYAPEPQLPPTKNYERRLVKLAQHDDSWRANQVNWVEEQELERVAKEMREAGISEESIQQVVAGYDPDPIEGEGDDDHLPAGGA